MSSPSYDDFVNRFGLSDVKAIIDAADSHKNGIHDKPGSDYFRWALLICISHECLSKPDFHKAHCITTPWAALESWMKEPAQLEWFSEHDGDVDYLGLFCGVYTDYLPGRDSSEQLSEKWMPLPDDAEEET